MIRRSCQWPAVVFAAFFSLLLVCAPARGGVPTLDELRERIADSERKLENIKIDAKYRNEKWDEAGQKWVYNGEGDCTAYYMGIPGGKVRIDYHKHVLAWDGGPVPFTNSVYSAVYDGKATQVLWTQQGDPKKPWKRPEGQIAPGRGFWVKTEDRNTGWECSLYGVPTNNPDGKPERFSKQFDRLRTGLIQLSVDSVTDGGATRVRLTKTATKNTRKFVYYFDPSRAYALTKGELFVDQAQAVWSFEATALKKLGNDVYYPEKLISTRFDDNGKPSLRTQWEASALVANAPHFDEKAVFTVDWIPGAVVHDAAKKSILQADDAGELQFVTDVREKPAEGPSDSARQPNGNATQPGGGGAASAPLDK
jgi:hypothetical protein